MLCKCLNVIFNKKKKPKKTIWIPVYAHKISEGSERAKPSHFTVGFFKKNKKYYCPWCRLSTSSVGATAIKCKPIRQPVSSLNVMTEWCTWVEFLMCIELPNMGKRGGLFILGNPFNGMATKTLIFESRWKTLLKTTCICMFLICVFVCALFCFTVIRPVWE